MTIQRQSCTFVNMPRRHIYFCCLSIFWEVLIFSWWYRLVKTRKKDWKLIIDIFYYYFIIVCWCYSCTYSLNLVFGTEETCFSVFLVCNLYEHYAMMRNTHTHTHTHTHWGIISRTWWVKCSPMAQETGVQWYLMTRSLIHSIIKYGQKVSGAMLGKY